MVLTPSDNLGTTSLTEHKIDVGSQPPIKQRCYLVSSKVQEAIRAKVERENVERGYH